MIITIQKDYKPGDMPPDGYLAWHAWAEVQRKAGIKQITCSNCGLWCTPQELSDKIVMAALYTKRGTPVVVKQVTCKKCFDNEVASYGQ